MILADTHTVLWLDDDDPELSRTARSVLVDARTDSLIAISSITLWEIALLVSRDRVSITMALPAYLRQLEDTYTVLAVDAVVAERASRFGRRYPRDPADRLIGATALVYAAALVTKDAKIRASGEVECIW